MFTLLRRIIRSGWQSFRRDGEIAVATIFVLFLAVMLVSVLYLFRDVAHSLVENIQERIDISVYFKEDVAEADILEIKKEIFRFPEVKEVEYVSKDQALEDFIVRHEQDSILLESIEEVGRNPFLASLNIKAWDPSQYEKVSEFLKNPEFEDVIEKIDYYQRKLIIERICSLNSIISKTGMILSVILIAVAVAVTFNTIRLSIYNSRKEIKVQRLVGASNWFIRGPFIVQGIICGLLAALISLLLLTLTCKFVSTKTENFFFDLDVYSLFIKNFWTIVTIQIITGIGLGIVSSSIAIRKYLKI